MIFFDAVAYIILGVLVLGVGLLVLMLAIAFIMVPIGAFIQEYEENPSVAWWGLFGVLCVVSALYLNLREKGIL